MIDKIPVLSYREKGRGVHVDLDVLVRSRMLIQANSGGGKSWALRQLLEETFGKVQHIVLDDEGEFGTLREEHHDYVLAARHGADVEASPRTAKLLCRRLMETSASAIIDLYDHPVLQRREFVRIFLTELMALPKDLRRPLLIVLDEAHKYAPEGAKSEAAEAVVAVASQGRKRGYALVCATQRLSKLSKDVAAELNVKMIGRTGLDLDVKRAGDELGMDKESRSKLPLMEPGTFYVFGPAILPVGAPRLVRTGAVKTSHPEPGAIEAPTPPPSARVRALLTKALGDLPQQAAEEARTVTELQRENATLRTQLTKAEKGLTAKVVEKPVADPKAIERAVDAASREFRAELAAAQSVGNNAMKLITKTAGRLDDLLREFRRAADPLYVSATAPVTIPRPPAPADVVRGLAARVAPAVIKQPRESSSNGTMAKGERVVLSAIAQHSDGVTREQLTVLTGYKRSSRDTYLQRLQQNGYVSVSQDTISATEEGITALGNDYEPLPTGDALYEHWIQGTKLTAGERKILQLLHESYPVYLTREAISQATEYKRSSRDTYLQRLAARKLTASKGDGIRTSDALHDG